MRRFLGYALAALAVLFTVNVLAPAAYAVETELTVQTIDINGLDITLAAANTDGSKFLNPSDERTVLICANSNGSTRTVTAETQAATLSVPGYGTVTLLDQASVVPITTGLTVIGPFPAAQFNDSSGYAHVTYSAVTGLTCGAARLVRPAP
jgi:hypothetical protein